MSRYERDPVSVLFDQGARRLLSRAYAQPGRWAGTRLTDPSPRHLSWLASQGIDPDGPDNPSAEGGTGLNARGRWARGFVRALYYQHRWFSPVGRKNAGAWRQQRRTVARETGGLVVDIGRRVPATGVLPAGRAVRVKLERGGQVKAAATRKVPASGRWINSAGGHGPRSSAPELRDWS